MIHRAVQLVWLALAAAGSCPVCAADIADEKVNITVRVAVEEGKKILLAEVTKGSKPVQGAKVGFFVDRMLGELTLGAEETLEDGTAGIDFPKVLPGDESGRLLVKARVLESPEFAGITGSATVEGGIARKAQMNPFPRALWSRYAPMPLVVVLVVLGAGVWATYAYVIIQLVKIRNAGG